MSNRVAYFYDDQFGDIFYEQGHPMKPQRVRMTHQLIVQYSLFKYLHVYRPHRARSEEMTQFHFPDYISALQSATPLDAGIFKDHGDCPVFDGLLDLVQISAGASIDAAAVINHGLADTCINWGGGMHHAKRNEPSGFCYVNDIVLCILELLKYHSRVLYVDIDVHHGDGVEEAFYNSNRVLTCSFHKYGKFFPGTGSMDDIGIDSGMYHTLNIPLKSGMNDQDFENLFKPIVSSAHDHFQPSAIVIQCGADMLAYDKLGPMNLSMKGHAECVRFCQSFGKPTILLGGGGYTIPNVARCWVNETALVLGQTLPDEIPQNDYYSSYGPSYKLYFEPNNKTENKNTPQMLDKLMSSALEHIKQLEAAPSVQLHDAAPDFFPKDILDHIYEKPTISEFYDKL